MLKENKKAVSLPVAQHIYIHVYFVHRTLYIVNQQMPKVRYLAPFTASLLTERTGDRQSYNDDVEMSTPKMIGLVTPAR